MKGPRPQQASPAGSKHTGAGGKQRLLLAIRHVEGLVAPLNWKHMLREWREVTEVGCAQSASGGILHAASLGSSWTVTGNWNSQMLTEKQVKLVRFHRLYSERKKCTTSEACKTKWILLLKFLNWLVGGKDWTGGPVVASENQTTYNDNHNIVKCLTIL